MREVIRFDTNVPQTVELEEKDGTVTQGRYGDQMRYWLTDNRVMWVEMEVAARITQLGVDAGEPFTICKREKRDGRKKGIAWEVAYLGESGAVNAAAALAASPARANSSPASDANRSTGPTEPMKKHQLPQSNAGMNSAAGLSGDGLMGYRLALSAAIVIAQEAEAFAKSRGFLLQFGGEDVRAMAATIYIQAEKSSQNPQQFYGAVGAAAPAAAAGKAGVQ